MQTSKEGLMALIGYEGIVTGPYLDSKKVPTIGIGHTAAAGWPDPKTYTGDLTVSEAFALFRKDVAKYEAAVNQAVKVPLKQHEFDALVLFHYNTGAIAKATLTKSLNAGDKALAAKQFMNWTKPPEITARRAAERDLFVTGKYPAPFANVYPAKNNKVLWGSAVRVDLRTKLAELAPVTPKPADAPKPVPAPEVAPKVQPAPAPAPVARKGLIGLIVALFAAVAKMLGKK